MKKTILFVIFFSLINILVKAQCGGPVLTVTNPSFEGNPAPHVTPPGWDICMPGVTPDTQPGSWGITLPAYCGSTYVAFVYGGSSWVEGASQTLSSPMVAGTTYNFSLALASTASTGGGIDPGCVELQIWGNMGGNSGCDNTELLWSSGNVYDAAHMDQWVLHQISFTPTQNYGHLLFLIHDLGCSTQPYIMLDCLSPIVPVSDIASFSTNTVCVGTPTVFTDQSSSTSGILTNWSWDFGDSTAIDINQNTSHTYSAPGTYSVTLTIVSDLPCTTSIVNQVIVYDFPTVTASAYLDSICSGMPSTLTASGATTYSWSHSLGTTNPVDAYPTTSTTYTVTGTSNGCSSSASVDVYVGQLQLSSAVTNHVSCFGGNDGSGGVTISTGTPPYTYIWDPSGGIGPVATNLAAGTYTVTVTDVVGCTSTASITINEPPLLEANITDSTVVTCFGYSTGNATVTASGGTQPYTYSWSPLGGTGATSTGIPAGTYNVTVTDNLGCTATDFVILNSAPEIGLILTPTDESCLTYCNGSISSTLTGNYSQPVSYAWNTNPVQNTATATGLCPGDYTLTVTYSINNCFVIETANIITSTLISADFTADSIEGYVPLTVHFTYTGYGASTFYWDFGDGSSSNVQNPVHTYENMSDPFYYVVLVVTSGPPDYCEDIDTIAIHAILPSSILVPNIFTPNNDGINDVFQIESQSIQTITISIFNRWGKKVYTMGVSDFTIKKEKKDIWDGTSKNDGKCADGTYFYILDAVGNDRKEYHMQGTITLLR